MKLKLTILFLLASFYSFGQGKEIKSLPTSSSVDNNTYFIGQQYSMGNFGNALKIPASQISTFIGSGASGIPFGDTIGGSGTNPRIATKKQIDSLASIVSTPTLQQVTTAGQTTTNFIKYLDGVGNYTAIFTDGVFRTKASTKAMFLGLRTDSSGSISRLEWQNGANTFWVDVPTYSGNMKLHFQNDSGYVALLDDTLGGLGAYHRLLTVKQKDSLAALIATSGSYSAGTITVNKIGGSSFNITGIPTGIANNITGTSNRITVTGGTTANVGIDISSSYVGQSTITTLGTIGTGIWNSTKIGLAYGGTNADLSATGGTSRVLMQTSLGANISVAQLSASDLSNGTNGSGGGVVLAIGSVLTTPDIGAATGTSLNVTGQVEGKSFRYDGSTSGQVVIKSPASVTTYTVVLPAVVGTAGQVLMLSDNAGTAAWQTPSGGSSGVSSYNGRTGTVTPASGDYNRDLMGSVTTYTVTSAANTTFDPSNGTEQVTTLAQSTTLTITKANLKVGVDYYYTIIENGTGGYTVTMNNGTDYYFVGGGTGGTNIVPIATLAGDVSVMHIVSRGGLVLIDFGQSYRH